MIIAIIRITCICIHLVMLIVMLIVRCIVIFIVMHIVILIVIRIWIYIYIYVYVYLPPPKWVVFCSSQAGRVVQPRGAPRQPTLFSIPRWLAGGAAHLDHTLPPRRSPKPCLLNTLGAGVVQIGLFFVPPRPGAWSNRAAPHTNPHYLLFRAGWRGAPPIWTTPCRRHPVC